MENQKQPAYGCGFTTADGSSHLHEKGLTKLEIFTMHAMQGLLASGGYSYSEDDMYTLQQRAAETAERMLKWITPTDQALEERDWEHKRLLSHKDTTVGLWATDRPDLIPEDIKSQFFRIEY